jgi:hypothetical protein
MPCASGGTKASKGGPSPAAAAYRYDVVLAPVGCFGDDLESQACDTRKSTACLLGRTLARVVGGCGVDNAGAILGDNFYPNGVNKKSRNLGRFDQELWEKFFRHRGLQMPWYGTVGNHDVHPWFQLRRGDIVAERPPASLKYYNASAVASSLNAHRYFHMPNYHHASPIHGTGDATVQFFFLNVEPVTGVYRIAEQAEWLDAQLKASPAKWKIVLSHRMIWGFMDFTHIPDLTQHIHPVLVRHRVPLYIAAHQHSVSFMRVTGGYYQLVSAGYSDNLHSAVLPRRPFGFYHVGRGAASVHFNATHAVGAHDGHHRETKLPCVSRAHGHGRMQPKNGWICASSVSKCGLGAASWRRPQRERIRVLRALAFFFFSHQRWLTTEKTVAALSW